jgi:WD40 repeat protein
MGRFALSAVFLAFAFSVLAHPELNPNQQKDANGNSFQELLTLPGHTGIVTSLAFSPDGKRVVTGSIDKTIKVWDTANGNEIMILREHSLEVNCVAYSADGSKIASAGCDGAKVWDASSGRKIINLSVADKTDHIQYYFGVVFSPDGAKMIATSTMGLMEWDTATGRQTKRLASGASSIDPWCASISADGKKIATCYSQRTYYLNCGVRVWDTTNTVTDKFGYLCWKATLTIKRAADGIDGRMFAGPNFVERKEELDIAPTFAALSPDGTKVAACGIINQSGYASPTDRYGWGRTLILPHTRFKSNLDPAWLKVWDVANGKELFELKGHPSAVWGVAFSPDGKQIVSGGHDSTARVWDATNGKEIMTLKGHAGPVSCVAFSPDGTKVASGSYDNTVKIWGLGAASATPAPKTAPESSEKKPASTPENLKVIAQKNWSIKAEDAIDKQRPGSHFKIAPATGIAGKTYVIEMKRLPESAVEPHLRLQDEKGNILAQSEISADENVRIVYTSPQDFKGFLVMTTAGPNQFGAFGLVISEVIAAPPAGNTNPLLNPIAKPGKN